MTSFPQNFTSSDHEQENENFCSNELKTLNFIYDYDVEDTLQKKYKRAPEW